MKTERLYYDEPYLLEFEARVIGHIEVGGKFGLVLDRSAFYPTSGGQPNDLGSIQGIPVLDVYEDEVSGSLVHVVPEKISAETIRGVIDESRRRDHMQQHSGQHVLSQAFIELFNWPTVSFHLGNADSTIDLPAEGVTRDQADQAEALANRIVQENRSVAIRYVSHDNLAEAGLRKPTERVGDIRIIDIAGFDRSACGGTHVNMTSEISAVLVTGIERVKKQSRVHFICGNRVLQYGRQANRTLESISQTISAAPFDTAAGVRSAWDDLQRSRKRIEELESRLLDYEAAEFPVKDGLAVAAFKNRGIDTLKLLAMKVCARPGTVALFADEGDQLRVVFARSADSPVDAASILKRVLERFGGRGGGRPTLAQGGGLTAESPQAVLDFAVSASAEREKN